MLNTDRLYFMDNLKTLLIFGVVLTHAGVVYESSGVMAPYWIVDDPATSDFPGLVNLILDLFVMPGIFFISGYFTPASLKKNGSLGFLKARFIRLIIPWTIAVLTLMPLFKVIFLYSRGLPQESWTTYFHFSNGTLSMSWLWFLPVLFLFDFAYALIAKLDIPIDKLNLGWAIAGAVLVSVVYTVVLAHFELTGWTKTIFLDFQNERLLPYFLIFLVGALCSLQRMFDTKKRNMALYIAVNATAWIPINVYVIVLLNYFLHPGEYIVSELVDGFLFWFSLPLSMLVLLYSVVATFKFFLNRKIPLLTALSELTYGVYIIHIPVLGLLSLALLGMNLPALVKYPILAVTTYAGSNLIVKVYLRARGLMTARELTMLKSSASKALRIFIGLTALCFVCCCAGRNRVEQPKQATAPKIAHLPGYWEGEVSEPVFGGKIHLLEAGPLDAPPVLLIHGLGDSGARDWYPVIPELCRRYRVIAPDLPGFARSTKANALYSPTRYVEVLEWLVDRNTSGKIDIIGHSLGGAIALLYAGTYPARVRRLALADVAGVVDRHVFVDHLADTKLSALDKLGDGQGDVFGFAMSGLLGISTTFELHPQKLLESKEERAERLDGDPLKIAGLALILHNFGPAISAAEMPTLLVWGSDDSIAPMRTGVLLDERMSNSRLRVIDGAGHVPMADLPWQFNEEISAFLSAPEESLAVKTAASRDFASGRTEHAKGKKAPLFEGDFDRVVIESCQNARIRNARIKELIVKRSTVTIERTNILGVKYGIDVLGSQMRMTGGSISGRTGIRTDGSIIDLAGVLFDVDEHALECIRTSQVVYSVCPVKDQDGDVVYRHGLQTIAARTLE